MKQSLLVLLLILGMRETILSLTFYVTSNGNGTGLSWSQASGDLAAILFVAEPGDEIWVAKGTYKPSSDKNRNKSFVIPSGVKLYGGFVGAETSVKQRNVQLNRTILTGNIGSPDDFSDNSFNVVVLLGSTNSTVIDGFIIEGGTADGTGAAGTRERAGAGMYIDASGRGTISKPIIRNCTFTNNYARDGGAVYVNAKSGHAAPVFENCQFESNRSDLDGGAVYNDGRHGGVANSIFNNCTFSGNQGNYGGAVFNYGGRGESSPVFQNCTFRANEAYLRGGAIYNMDIEGKSLPSLNNCQFVANVATAGESIYIFSKPDAKSEPLPTNIFRMN